jgi:hypothetical protein
MVCCHGAEIPSTATGVLTGLAKRRIGVTGLRATDLSWRKSSASGDQGACVEVSFDGKDRVLVRHSQDPGGAVLGFTRPEWDAFLTGVRAGEFDG